MPSEYEDESHLNLVTAMTVTTTHGGDVNGPEHDGDEKDYKDDTTDQCSEEADDR